MPQIKASSASRTPQAGASERASRPVSRVLIATSRISSAWARLCRCSNSSRLSARLRMVSKPRITMAREMVLTAPPYWLKLAEFTTFSSLLVSDTS